MTISRRWFMAGLALTGAAVPAAFYGHREWTKPDPTITPGEASFDVADVAGQHLANTLRGVWQVRFEGHDAGIEGLPRDGLEVFLDIGHKGRGLSGFLDTAERLRSSEVPRYRVLGDLSGAKPAQLSWRLLSASGAADYEFSMALDEVWAAFGNAGSGSLSGRVLDLDRPLMLTAQDNRFIAVKKVFP
ncbi:MAG: PvdJ/PvdD/PvdP-like protein, partial [Pseudomonas sp.]